MFVRCSVAQQIFSEGVPGNFLYPQDYQLVFLFVAVFRVYNGNTGRSTKCLNLIEIRLAQNARQRVRTAILFCWVANINRERLWIGQGFNRLNAGGNLSARLWQTGACGCCLMPYYYCNRNCNKNQATNRCQDHGQESLGARLRPAPSPNTMDTFVSGRLCSF